MARPRTEIVVGLFVFIGFLILSMIVFFVSGVYFFRPGYHLKAQFDYVGIVNKGAPVRFSGVRVGEVSSVTIKAPSAPDEVAKVIVDFFVEKGVVIKDNYLVSIRGNHIMSEPHIAITPLPGPGRILEEGDEMTNSVTPLLMEDLFEEGKSILKRTDKLLESVGSALEDPETQSLLYDSLKKMNALLNSMNEIVVGEEGQYREMIVNINRTADGMANALERINNAEGTLGKLISEDEVYNDLRDFVREIKVNPWRLFKKA